MEGAALETELERVRRGETRLALRSLRSGEGLLELRSPAGKAVDEAGAAERFGELRVSELPEGAVLLDCRSEAMRRWRPEWPAVQPGPLGAVDAADYDATTTYVAFCPQGQRSASVAEQLREGGVPAYSFEGGEGALKKYLDSLRASDGRG